MFDIIDLHLAHDAEEVNYVAFTPELDKAKEVAKGLFELCNGNPAKAGHRIVVVERDTDALVFDTPCMPFKHSWAGLLNGLVKKESL